MYDYLLRGGPVMWVILACSVVSLGIILERACFFVAQRERRRALAQRLCEHVRRREWAAARRLCEPPGGPLSAVLGASLAAVDRGKEAVEAQYEAAVLQWREGPARRLRALAVLAQVCPLLGLLGTVTGMVGAFRAAEQAGYAVQASALAGGIWEALLTTAFGLAVAIPTAVAYHAFEGMIERWEQEMHQCVHLLLSAMVSDPGGGSEP